MSIICTSGEGHPVLWYDVALPDRPTARAFTRSSFQALATPDRKVRMRLCELVEHCALACAEDENPNVLSSAAYLQEVGVIHSSTDKAIYSLQMVEQTFGDSFVEFDARLVDCIRNHVRTRTATTAEGRLMQICHKYVTTHYLDYLFLKRRLSAATFEHLQLERIAAYSQYLRDHPRGNEIGLTLHSIFYSPSSDGTPLAPWRHAVRELRRRFHLNEYASAPGVS